QIQYNLTEMWKWLKEVKFSRAETSTFWKSKTTSMPPDGSTRLGLKEGISSDQLRDFLNNAHKLQLEELQKEFNNFFCTASAYALSSLLSFSMDGSQSLWVSLMIE